MPLNNSGPSALSGLTAATTNRTVGVRLRWESKDVEIFTTARCQKNTQMLLHLSGMLIPLLKSKGPSDFPTTLPRSDTCKINQSSGSAQIKIKFFNLVVSDWPANTVI